MAAIIPIPTSRTSNQLVTQRFLSQLQFNQLELLKAESQMSSGRRVSVPSEDASAALRGMTLQRLLEQKGQVQTNLAAGNSYLSATDVTLSGASDVLIDLRAAAIAVADNTVGDVERQAASETILRGIQQLTNIGNAKFRGRFLFAGSQTAVSPFEVSGNYVHFVGNETDLHSFSDVDLLFDTNVNGNDVFGAISPEMRGSVDFNPILTEDTRLADLRGGAGISEGTIAVSDGSSTARIDLSTAETIGDVARLIESSPPTGGTVTVRVGAEGLSVQLDQVGGGNLTIRQVGGGTTAAELGILEETGIGTGQLVGDDLDPLMKLTTPLDDILGVRASAMVQSAGANNDLIFEMRRRGDQPNGITIQFVDDGSVVQGGETMVYDDSNPANRTLTIKIESGATTANDIIAAVEADATVNALMSARLDSKDTQVELLQGLGTIDPTAVGVTIGGSGIEFDRDSGLRVENGGQTYDLSFQDARTVEDLLNVLNGSNAGLAASINKNANGIDIRSRLSGSDFHIGENGGTTATELGVRSFTTATRLDDLNLGFGVNVDQQADFTIQRTDGVSLEINVSSAQTVGEVIDLINNHPDNQDPLAAVVARLAVTGNGIELVDANAAGTGTLTVTRHTLSQAAWDLGLVPRGQDQVLASLAGPATLTGTDVAPLEVKGAFNSLIRLNDALAANDTVQIGRAVSMLNDDIERLVFVRAEVGARQQALEVIEHRLEDESIELKDALSQEIDVDMIEAISNITALQLAYEASLRMVAQTAQLSLMDFL